MKTFFLSFLSLCFINFSLAQSSTSHCQDDPITLVATAPCDGLTLCEEYGNLPPTILTGNGNASSIFGNSLDGEVIHVSGVFNIDNEFHLKDCIIKMDVGSSINVNTTNTFTIENCKIFCCEYGMWRGIDVTTNGRIIVNEGSEIEDARIAVNLDDPDICKIQNSHINKSEICVKIQNNTGFCRYSIYGSTFNCDNELNGESIYFSSHDLAYTGILIENSKYVNIGVEGKAINIFYYHSKDIDIINSTVCIRQSQFKEQSLWGTYGGINILASDDSYVCVHGLGEEEGAIPTFAGAPRANIYGINSTIRCYNSTFHDTGVYAILIENPGDHYFSIENNRFEDNTSPFPNPVTKNVIRAVRGNVANDFIRNNYFNYDYPFSTAFAGGSIIDVTDNGNTSNFLFIDYNNEFWTNQTTAISIHGGNSSKNIIENNHIHSNFDSEIGILFNSGISGSDIVDRNAIINNTIDDGTTFTIDKGINVIASEKINVCNNILLNKGTAIKLKGNCTNSIIGSNEFKDNHIGLFLEGPGINLGTNTNIHRGNIWEGTFNIAATHTGGPDYIFSRFFVNPDPITSCGNTLYFPNSNGLPSVIPPDLFFPEEGCLEYCNLLPTLEIEPSNLRNAILNGSYDNLSLPPAVAWNTKFSIYRELYGNPDYEHVGFMVNNLNGSYHLLTLVEEKIGEAAELSNQTRESFLSTYSYFDSLFNLYTNLYNQYSLDPTNAALEATLIDLVNQLNLSKTDMNYWKEVAWGERLQKLDEAIILNDQILSQNEYEANMKMVNSIRIHHLSNVSLNEEMVETLEEIAGKCFDEGGPAIYFANVLLPACRRPEIFPASCAEQKSGIHLLKPENEQRSLNIYPNPAANNIHVQNSDINNLNDQWEIYNINGKTMLSGKFYSEYTISISSLPDGVYYLKLSSKNGTIETYPFAKITN